jgi:hypothetical protein
MQKVHRLRSQAKAAAAKAAAAEREAKKKRLKALKALAAGGKSINDNEGGGGGGDDEDAEGDDDDDFSEEDEDHDDDDEGAANAAAVGGGGAGPGGGGGGGGSGGCLGSPMASPAVSAAALEAGEGLSLTYLDELLYKLQQIKDVLGRGRISGVTRKLQIKAVAWAPVPYGHLDDDEDGSGEVAQGGGIGLKVALRATKLQIILKWGGALTPLGEAQAQLLGETLRKKLYPDPSGGGVLRLHST